MTGKLLTSETPRQRDQASTRRRRMPMGADHERPAGVQGANVGYWQAVGSSRAAAKRSKRP
jgi:hypothetical protein